MKFGIYCNNFNTQNLEALEVLFDSLKELKEVYSINEKLADSLGITAGNTYDRENLKEKADVLVTVGGDGTILSAVDFVYGSRIPIIGVNTGRLGFLTSLTAGEFKVSLPEIIKGNFKVEERVLIELETSEKVNIPTHLALNEISLVKKDTSSMITIHAFLDNEFLNTYWADGLIISTATGSTAYSLSCGGPIMAPGSGNLIITPIAPHNLNVRPLVIPDNSEIKLSFEARSNDLLLSLDSSSCIIPDSVEIKVRKAKGKIGLLRPKDYSYLETLRSKLNWGLDKRN